MPGPRPSLRSADVPALIAELCAGEGDRQVGIELEWMTLRSDSSQPQWELLDRAVAGAGSLPAGGHVTLEPGGQVELSTRPLPGVDEALASAAADAAHLEAALADADVRLVSSAGPAPDRLRVVNTPRYRAMESYFARLGSSGSVMMRGTAALQVNLDLGPPALASERWETAHAIGPALLAMFANSPARSSTG